MRHRRHAGKRTAHTNDWGTRGQGRARVAGMRVMTVFLIAFIVLTALASGGSWSSASAPVPERIHLDVSAPYGDDPASALAWDWRKEMGARLDGFNPFLNVAVAFVDVTGKTAGELNVSKGILVDVGSLRSANPGLYAAINPGPGVRTLLRIVRSNANKVRYAGSNGFHSEERIYSFLDERGISHDKVLLLYSDRDPCKKRCSPLIRADTRVLFLVKGSRNSMREKLDKSIQAKIHEEETAVQRACAAASLLTPPASTRSALGAGRRNRSAATLTAARMPLITGAWPAGQAPGAARWAYALASATCGGLNSGNGLAKGMAQAGASLGGIDFSSLQLRYLADSGTGGVRYAFTAAPAGLHSDNSPAAGLLAAQQASDSFFVWLELPTSVFWVNLNPTQPNKIIDPSFGLTDAGRILLQADLQLKKTTGQLIYPDTPLGSRFWHALSGRCMSFRTWIVPAPATVYSDNGQLFILSAPLNVLMETQYLKMRGVQAAAACPHQQHSTEARNEALFRKLILPRIRQAVNTAPAYAALRRVYLSRVAAEWYRRRSLSHNTAFGSLIDGGDITPWLSRQPWDPISIFHQYVRSYVHGQFKVTHRSVKGNVIQVQTFIYGGVDFTSVPYRTVTADQFRAAHPGLSAMIGQSLSHPVTDSMQFQIWLGGTAEPGLRNGSINTSSPSNPSSDSFIYIFLLFVALATGGRILRRRLSRARR